MAVRQILGAVGFVVGAYFGAPQLGYMIGSAIGNAIDPQIIKGPSIGDIATQTSQEGVPRPIVFGLSPPMAGNIIVSGPPKKVTKTKSRARADPRSRPSTSSARTRSVSARDRSPRSFACGGTLSSCGTTRTTRS